jgi:hypothetical protein
LSRVEHALHSGVPVARPDDPGGVAHPRRAGLLLLGVAAAALLLALIVLATGGVVVRLPFIRLTSRDATRPLIAALIAAVLYAVRYRGQFAHDVGRIRSMARFTPASPSWAGAAAAALAFAALFVAIQWGSFVAAGADASGYVSQAELWLHGDLVRPRPTWTDDQPWPREWATTPLGYRPALELRMMVPTYSPGLPLLMAVLQGVGGRPAVYYVVPFFGAAGIWLTYLLGSRLAGRQAGLLAALLLLASPSFLHMLVQPMIDVPSAAAWTCALYFAIKPGLRHACAAGVATALAILIRPNIAPLAAVVGLVLVLQRAGVRRVAVFALAAAPAAVVVALLNQRYYGSALVSGYGSLAELYAVDRVWPNLTRYTGWLLATQTPAVLLAAASPWVWPNPPVFRRAIVPIVTLAFPLALLALYLPYYVYGDWSYVRFLLPGLPGLCIGAAGVVVALASRIRSRPGRLVAPWLVAAAVAVYGASYSDGWSGRIKGNNTATLRVVDYIPQLPERSVFVSLTYSGSIHYYTGRDVLRWETLFEPVYIDRAVDHLEAKGHSVYLVNDYGEMNVFRAQFAGTRTVQELAGVMPVDIGDALIYPLGRSEPPPPPRRR